MRIVTWNCARGPLSKKLSALQGLCPDIAIMCEAPPPAAENEQTLWFPSDAPKLGVQVHAYNGYSLDRLPSADLPNCVNPVAVKGEKSFNLLAVWTWDVPSYIKAFNAGIDAYADLIASGPTVIAGDFNGNPGYDKPRQWVKWGDAFMRLNYLGLVSAYHQINNVQYGDEPCKTYRHRRSSDPIDHIHIDFCFVPKSWINNDMKVNIESATSWTELSDHYPVVADFPFD